MRSARATAVCFFGSHLIRVDDCVYYLGITGPTLDLYRYLLLFSGKAVRREYLAELFWGRSSPSRQRSALNSAVWRIKKQLTDLAGIDLRTRADAVCLEIAPTVPVDVHELTEVMRLTSREKQLNEALADRLNRALGACADPFMGGAVEEWALAERERLRNLRLRGLTMLMHWFGERKRYENALEIGRKLLLLDPFREAVQCELMWLYVLSGQRAQALRQYRRYAVRLKAELDIEPMAETRALYNHIREGLDCGALPRGSDGGLARAFLGGSPEPRAELDRILGAIEQSRRDLYRTLRAQFD